MESREQLKWPDLVKKVARQTEVDPLFKEKLLASPRASLQQVVGHGLPASFTDENIRGFAQKMFQATPVGEDELSDVELEQVAGGKECSCCCA